MPVSRAGRINLAASAIYLPTGKQRPCKAAPYLQMRRTLPAIHSAVWSVYYRPHRHDCMRRGTSRCRSRVDDVRIEDTTHRGSLSDYIFFTPHTATTNNRLRRMTHALIGARAQQTCDRCSTARPVHTTTIDSGHPLPPCRATLSSADGGSSETAA